MNWLKELFRDKTLEDLVMVQQKRIDALETLCKSYDREFESIRIRLSKPDIQTPGVIQLGKGSNWLEDRRRLEAEFASKTDATDVMITR